MHSVGLWQEHDGKTAALFADVINTLVISHGVSAEVRGEW